MTDKFQAVVIGGGPGGYVCAIRLSQLGLKTACIESRGSLGGTCLNIGCIPSKSLLNLSEEFHKAKNLSNKGIEVGEIKLNLSKMMKNKDKAVTILTKGVEFLLKKNKVTYFKGTGSFKSKNEILKVPKMIIEKYGAAYHGGDGNIGFFNLKGFSIVPSLLSEPLETTVVSEFLTNKSSSMSPVWAATVEALGTLLAP